MREYVTVSFSVLIIIIFSDDIALDERVLSRVQRSSMVKLLYPEAERGKPGKVIFPSQGSASPEGADEASKSADTRLYPMLHSKQ